MKLEKLRHLQCFFRKFGRRTSSTRSIKACPRCGSVNIKFSSKLDVWLTPKRYMCSDCGYVGPIVLEVEEDEEEKEERSD